MTTRKFVCAGFDCELITFHPGYAFLYPQFNGNAEFPATRKGYRKLSSYLRFIKIIQSYENMILEDICS